MLKYRFLGRACSVVSHLCVAHQSTASGSPANQICWWSNSWTITWWLLVQLLAAVFGSSGSGQVMRTVTQQVQTNCSSLVPEVHV
jgi:hypothetical protein